jgi:anti-sigma B factor antagonist
MLLYGPDAVPVALVVEATTSPRGFRIAGDLDVSTVGLLADALEPSVEQGGDLTLDLSGVTFVDSTGLQLLMQAARKLEGRGRLALVSPQPRVRLLFDYVLLDRRANVDIVGGEEPRAPA